MCVYLQMTSNSSKSIFNNKFHKILISANHFYIWCSQSLPQQTHWGHIAISFSYLYYHTFQFNTYLERPPLIFSLFNLSLISLVLKINREWLDRFFHIQYTQSHNTAYPALLGRTAGYTQVFVLYPDFAFLLLTPHNRTHTYHPPARPSTSLRHFTSRSAFMPTVNFGTLTRTRCKITGKSQVIASRIYRV